jgi:hypothetical protein
VHIGIIFGGCHTLDGLGRIRNCRHYFVGMADLWICDVLVGGALVKGTRIESQITIRLFISTYVDFLLSGTEHVQSIFCCHPLDIKYHTYFFNQFSILIMNLRSS